MRPGYSSCHIAHTQSVPTHIHNYICLSSFCSYDQVLGPTPSHTLKAFPHTFINISVCPPFHRCNWILVHVTLRTLKAFSHTFIITSVCPPFYKCDWVLVHVTLRTLKVFPHTFIITSVCPPFYRCDWVLVHVTLHTLKTFPHTFIIISVCPSFYRRDRVLRPRRSSATDNVRLQVRGQKFGRIFRMGSRTAGPSRFKTFLSSSPTKRQNRLEHWFPGSLFGHV